MKRLLDKQAQIKTLENFQAGEQLDGKNIWRQYFQTLSSNEIQCLLMMGMYFHKKNGKPKHDQTPKQQLQDLKKMHKEYYRDDTLYFTKKPEDWMIRNCQRYAYLAGKQIIRINKNENNN